MPSVKKHCAISKKRTGNDFAKLHKWIDESSALKRLGTDHRIERHCLKEDDKDTIKRNWGEKAVIEWLFHVAIDNLATAYKMSRKSFSYGKKAYNFMQIGFSKSGYIHCNFDTVDERELNSIFEDESEEYDY